MLHSCQKRKFLRKGVITITNQAAKTDWNGNWGVMLTDWGTLMKDCAWNFNLHAVTPVNAVNEDDQGLGTGVEMPHGPSISSQWLGDLYFFFKHLKLGHGTGSQLLWRSPVWWKTSLPLLVLPSFGHSCGQQKPSSWYLRAGHPEPGKNWKAQMYTWSKCS